MLSSEEDVEAHALHAQGWTISAIARHLDRDRKTVRAYLNGERQPDGWRLTDQAGASNAVVLGAEHTWRLCVRMLKPEAAEGNAEITGDHDLARAALKTVSIIRSD